jgi:cytochrome P450/NADPH-cytochrome P450 reductase
MKKMITGAFKEVRRLGGDGLFTARSDEENWGIAHRILVPAFSAKSLRDFIPEMCEKAKKLADKLMSQPAGEDVDILHWMICVTVDTISTCGFSYDLNTLSSDEEHPFVSDLWFCLKELQSNIKRGSIGKFFTPGKQRAFDEAVERMKEFGRTIIAENEKKGTDSSGKLDIMKLMLTGTDSKTGKKMSNENIINNIITFMIAGHETTASMMSWTLYLLTQHLDVLQKVRREVDTVCHDAFQEGRPLTEVETGKLRYTLQVIKESLRLYPSLGLIGKDCVKDTKVSDTWYSFLFECYLIVIPFWFVF